MLEELEREKEIKFFECLGDPPITRETVGSIEQKRTDIITGKENTMRTNDMTRYSTAIDQDKVVVDTNIDLID